MPVWAADECICICVREVYVCVCVCDMNVYLYPAILTSVFVHARAGMCISGCGLGIYACLGV